MREREREREKEKEKLNFFRTPEENFCEEKNEERRRGAEKISKNLPWKTKEEEEEEEEKEEEEIREALLHYFGDQNIG